MILEVITAVHGVETARILDRRTKAKNVRQMAMELCYRYCPLPQKGIGEVFGVDYSTVSQNRRSLKAKLASSIKLKKQFDKIEKNISIMSKQKI